MASRKANAREALSRRVEQIDGSSPTSADNKSIVAKLASGEGTSASDKYDFKQGGKIFAKPSADRDANINKFGDLDRRQKGKRQSHRLGKKPNPSIMTHFSGFQFANPSDAAWLGLDTKGKGKNTELVLGDDDTASRKGKGRFKSRRKKERKIVFFNSNEYLGYSGHSQNQGDFQKILDDQSLSVLRVNTRIVTLAAEERLLKTLVQFASARTAMKAAIQANILLHTSVDSENDKLIDWSSPDRDWLFNRLIDFDDDDPLPLELQEGGTPQQLGNSFQ
jgi:hypothetical protein